MKTTFKHFEITAVLSKVGVPFPGDMSRGGLHNEFKVTVKNTNDGNKTSFPFFASTFDYDRGVKEMDENSLLHAFYCLLFDAESGSQDFEWFCGNMGYDTDSRKAEKIWKACRKQYPKIQKIGAKDDLYELINELAELV